MTLGGKRIEPEGFISLPVSFKSLKNARTEFVIFDVVDIHYPYNTIFARGLLNTFEAFLYSAYLCLKVPANTAKACNIALISLTHGR
jgi:hypothetical protein